jgi:hypothetical protein
MVDYHANMWSRDYLEKLFIAPLFQHTLGSCYFACKVAPLVAMQSQVYLFHIATYHLL